MGIPDKRTKSLQHLALDGFIEPAAGRPVRVEDSMFPIWRTITLLNANDISPKLFEVCFKLFRFSCRKDHLDFQNPTISENHPARNASPPIGVTAPNHLKPVNTIMYRLPEIGTFAAPILQAQEQRHDTSGNEFPFRTRRGAPHQAYHATRVLQMLRLRHREIPTMPLRERLAEPWGV